MLKLRVLTALVLIPIVLWGIFFAPQLYFVGGCTLIIGVAAWEWARLAGTTNAWLRGLYVFVTLFLLIALRIGSYILQSEFVLGVATIWWLLIGGYLVYVRNKPQLPFWPKWLVIIGGLFSLSMCWEALLILHVQPQLLFFMLVLIWAADTFAYFGGRRWGKHKLAPTISPNKTWEGLACGVIASLIIGMLGEWFWITPKEINIWFLLAIAITILVSAAGDLFESLLKREQGLKDSGKLLPGHGGVLDRIDSLIAAAPVFTYCIITMGLLL